MTGKKCVGKISNHFVPQYEKLKNRYRYQGAAPQYNVRIQVNPSKIKFKLSNRFYRDELPSHGTYVRNGEWDNKIVCEDTIYARTLNGKIPPRGLIKFNEMPIYTSFKSHFTHDVEWEDTEFYKLTQNLHKCDYLTSTKYGPDTIDRRLEYVDTLYESMKDGYEYNPSSIVQDHIIINIGRDGRFILGGDGLHRTILSKILNIRQIPARIFVRHQYWQQKRYQAYKSKNINISSETHPDIANIFNNEYNQ